MMSLHVITYCTYLGLGLVYLRGAYSSGSRSDLVNSSDLRGDNNKNNLIGKSARERLAAFERRSELLR